MADVLSIANADGIEHRFQTYEAIRRTAPVYLDPVSGFYVVTDFADVRTIAMDAKRFSNRTNMLVGRSSGSSEEIARLYHEQGYPQVDTLSSNDPPSHRSFRNIVDRAFRPARVEQMADYMDRVINELIDSFEDLGCVEFVEHYAVALPMIVIADQMGVGRDQLQDFKRWSDAVMATANTLATPEAMVDAARTIIELQNFLASQFEKARAAPREDIISDIATAKIDDRLLEMKEMVGLALTLLVAGNETTTNALGSALIRLIETGAEEKIRNDPAFAVPFTEEVLRFDAPIQLLYRRAKENVEYKGIVIPEGAIIQLVWGAANRDAARFECPAHFKADRPAVSGHVTFGSGIHFCVGNVLARAEIVSTLQIMTRRLQDLRVANKPDAIERELHPLAYGPRRLVLTFKKRC